MDTARRNENEEYADEAHRALLSLYSENSLLRIRLEEKEVEIAVLEEEKRKERLGRTGEKTAEEEERMGMQLEEAVC